MATGAQEYRGFVDLVRSLVSASGIAWAPAEGASTSLAGEASYRQDIAELPVSEAHRRFQVRPDVTGPMAGGTFSGTRQDTTAELAVRVGYHLGGGDYLAAEPGDRLQVALLAQQDAEAIRQKVEHPGNRTGGVKLITWLSSRPEHLADRLIMETRFRADLRVTVEAR